MVYASTTADLILFLLTVFDSLKDMAMQTIDYLSKPVMPPIINDSIIDVILGPGFFAFLTYALVVWLIP